MGNIEKSAFRRDEYVGYGAGTVWRIVRSTSSYGAWRADPRELGRAPLYAWRLADLSRMLGEGSVALPTGSTRGYVAHWCAGGVGPRSSAFVTQASTPTDWRGDRT